jgi:hypothetical protein
MAAQILDSRRHQDNRSKIVDTAISSKWGHTLSGIDPIGISTLKRVPTQII